MQFLWPAWFSQGGTKLEKREMEQIIKCSSTATDLLAFVDCKDLYRAGGWIAWKNLPQHGSFTATLNTATLNSAMEGKMQ